MWAGRPDKFDFRIAGKKEILVPYNTYKIQQPNVTEAFQAHELNPDLVRWEKHRGWVLGSTLKPGRRHVYSRRTFHLDEDSWGILASDAYDQSGHMYRIGYDMTFPTYTAPEPFIYPVSFLDYDLERNAYNWQGFYGSPYNGRFVASDRDSGPEPVLAGERRRHRHPVVRRPRGLSGTGRSTVHGRTAAAQGAAVAGAGRSTTGSARPPGRVDHRHPASSKHGRTITPACAVGAGKRLRPLADPPVSWPTRRSADQTEAPA